MAVNPQKKKSAIGAWFAALVQRIQKGGASRGRSAEERAKRRRRSWRRLWHVILAGILICIITVSIVGCVLVVYVVGTFDPEEFIPILGEMSMDNRSVIYVENDKGDFEPYHNLQGGTSVWIDLEKIPLNMQNAVIAIEDERFRDHEGVDWKRTWAPTSTAAPPSPSSSLR